MRDATDPYLPECFSKAFGQAAKVQSFNDACGFSAPPCLAADSAIYCLLRSPF